MDVGKLLLTLISLSVVALASGHAEGAEAHTDIVARTINFLIFAGIVYYLIADPVKEFFAGRSQAIADEQNKVKEKLEESKREKEAALQEVEEANKFAEELKGSAKKENKILNDAIMAQCDVELENIEKQSLDAMDFEKRSMTRDVVRSIMDDVLSQESAGLDKDAMAQIVMKKVA